MATTLKELEATYGHRVTESLSSPSSDHIAKKKKVDTALPTCVDWSNIPVSCCIFGNDGNTLGSKPTSKKPIKKKEIFKMQRKKARAERKQRQCDAFVKAISALRLPAGSVIVDGGCGACGLTLPLAWTFPHLSFVGIDMNPFATKLMMEKVEAAALKNVQAFTSSISAFTDHFDVAIGLHACGQATDDIINLAVMNRKPYLVAPCCFGKLKFSFRSHAMERDTEMEAEGSGGGVQDVEEGYQHMQCDDEATSLVDTSLPLPLPAPVKRGPTPPKPIDENHCGYVARRLQENEGKWDALEYPRSSWLQTQLQAGAEEITRVATRVAAGWEEQRTALAGTETGATEVKPPISSEPTTVHASKFSERGDMRVLSLDERMASMYLTVAGFADNSHIRTVPDEEEISTTTDTPSDAVKVESESKITEPIKKQATVHDLYRLCSNVICVDRNEFAVEKAGYTTRICTMPGLTSSAKSDILIGWLPACLLKNWTD